MTLHRIATLALPILAVAACSPEQVIKREPGSWTQKVQILRLEGKGATPQVKAQMQAMFDAMAGMAICLTPEAAAKEDLAQTMEQIGPRGKNCKIGKRDETGATVGLSAVCPQEGGGTVKLSVTGTNATGDRDMTMKSEGFDAKGVAEGVMEMRVHAVRSGPCKAGDITPPATPAVKN
ncbi:DUF3617 family protein [Sphingomonas sp. CARO-RG-8B-R24-01]|uniref:DUF3617 domain-containing protein n=1 Tax=Sphingomonas sp. CARO-RG-8B-R24-01 TaxID=2914831 RepID=UPI001F596FF2|nr:DUF3617 family protein [Sphingomonas sp. CARO-RG-8B-R24-01]